MTLDEARRELSKVGRRRTAARRQIAQASADIRRLAPLALAGGMSKAEVCRLTGISRPALDAFLAEH